MKTWMKNMFFFEEQDDGKGGAPVVPPVTPPKASGLGAPSADDVAAQEKADKEAYDKLDDAGKKAHDDKKAADKKAADDLAAKGKKEGEQKAPDKYDLKSTSEGVELDTEAVAGFEAFARKNNMSQEAAQEALNLATEHFKKINAQQMGDFQTLRETWTGEFENDPEFGGAKLKASQEGSIKALRHFAGADYKPIIDVLNQTGLGDHPGLRRTFARLGRAMSEDRIPGGGGDNGAKDAASTLYPGHGKKT